MISLIIILLPINVKGAKLCSQSCSFFTCVSYQELHALKSLKHKFNFGLSSQFSELFDKIPVRILLDVLFHFFRFSKASFYHV